MAFGFFRRRQKMVMIIMVVLMVSFLIGFQGFNKVFSHNRTEMSLGNTSSGAVTIGDTDQAEQDMRLLATYLRLGQIETMQQQSSVALMSEQFLHLRNNNNPDTVYALLLKEAGKLGIRVGSEDVQALLDSLGLTEKSDAYRQLVSTLQQQNGSEKALRAAIGNWLTISRAYTSAAVDTPPSEQQLRQVYSELEEKIDLTVAKVRADEFLPQVPEPTAAEIDNQFRTYSGFFPNSADSAKVSSFGFGYRQPDRVAMEYLYFDQDVIKQSSNITLSQAIKFYREHKEEMVKTVPVETTTAPATSQPATASQPAEKTVQIEFDEAYPLIVERLKQEAVADKTDKLLATAKELADEYGKNPQQGVQPYQYIVAQMAEPADEILNRKISVNIPNLPLEQAVAELTKAANLEAIVFPSGNIGKYNLDKNVRVNYQANDVTLKVALQQIAEKIKWPKLAWKTCRNIEGAIFPTGPDSEINVFPVSAGTTPEPMSQQELSEHPILGSSISQARQPLVTVAFQVAELQKGQAKAVALVKVGEEGPTMLVVNRQTGQISGELMWRLTKVEASHVPATMTPEIRQQVVKDVRTIKAFDLADKKANSLLADAEKKGLEQAAKDAKIDSYKTGMFSRSRILNIRQQLYIEGMQQGMSLPDMFGQIMTAQPVAIMTSTVPGIDGLTSAAMRKELINKAFALAPQNVEPATQPATTQPYAVKPYALGVAELPPLREVVVMQRVDYRPAVVGEYKQAGRNEVLSNLQRQQQWQNLAVWFSGKAVEKRMNFTPRQAEQ